VENVLAQRDRRQRATHHEEKESAAAFGERQYCGQPSGAPGEGRTIPAEL
jgi:hypothetical protein